jgi:hypothetical protein
MGFFGDLWGGIKSVAGKVRDGINSGINWVKNVAGKVGDGIRWVKGVAGKVANIPIVGDVLKTAWNVLPYTDKVEKGLNLAETTADKVGLLAKTGEHILGGKNALEVGGRLRYNNDKIHNLSSEILAPFRATV